LSRDLRSPLWICVHCRELGLVRVEVVRARAPQDSLGLEDSLDAADFTLHTGPTVCRSAVSSLHDRHDDFPRDVASDNQNVGFVDTRGVEKLPKAIFGAMHVRHEEDRRTVPILFPAGPSCESHRPTTAISRSGAALVRRELRKGSVDHDPLASPVDLCDVVPGYRPHDRQHHSI
jgi:hypothetical protein